MTENKRIKSVLISVFHKDGLEPIIQELQRLDIKIYATGGSRNFIESKGASVIPVEDITAYPSILGGRVKTLHPKIFGGILSRREVNEDHVQLEEFDIPEIDLVIVDLYPFEETVSSGASAQDIIEKIDIGGISLIRAAAKNFSDVMIIPSLQDYSVILNILKDNDGVSTLAQRRSQSAKAFALSSAYDHAIAQYFSDEKVVRNLRYGENPHQRGEFKGDLDAIFEQLHGKELSYNNLLDIDAAIKLISVFDQKSVAVIKHNNACGLASGNDQLENWKRALAGDPVSAFGGIIVSNDTIDGALAAEMHKLFFEVLIAPGFDAEALKILKQKKNRIILQTKEHKLPTRESRSILNGELIQDVDNKTESISDMNIVTEKSPSDPELKDMVFANKIVKYSKSNAIVLAREEQLISSGVGQTSRVDALKHAIEKAKGFGFDLDGAVMASDAFFPFPDCVEIAHKAGITAIIQPGGSVKDQESIDYCNKNDLAMVLTGTRHFRH